MEKISKDKKIELLETKINSLNETLDLITKKNIIMTEEVDISFVHSPTYQQMLQQIEFLKNLNSLNEFNYANAKKSVKRADDNLQQIYKDNKLLISEKADTEYFVGITQNCRNAKQYTKWQEQIIEFEAKIEQQKEAIQMRDNEILRLQLIIGEIKCSNNDENLEIQYLQQENMKLHRETENYKIISPTSKCTRKPIDIIEHNIEQNIALVKTSHKKSGRPKKINDNSVEIIRELRKNGATIRDIASQLNISVGSVHRILFKNE